MLAFLQRWAYPHEIRLKLFNPCRFLPDRLEYAGSIPAFEMATLDEMIAFLGPCRWPICPRFLNIKSKEQTLC